MRQSRPVLTALLITSLAGAALSATSSPAEAAASAGPPITIRSTASASSTTGRSVTVDRPAGAQVGDVLVARVANRGDVTATIDSPGWTPVGEAHSAVYLKSVVFTRVVTSAEPSSYSFDVSAPTNLVASISAFDNVDTADPVDSYVGKVNGLSDKLRTPTVSPGVGNTMAVWLGTQLFAGGDCADAPIAPPADLTEVLDDCLPGDSGLALAAAYRQLGAPASHGTWVGTSAAARTNIAQVLTLRPAARLQEADRYVSASVDVGQLWDGYDALGARDTALPDTVLHEPSGLAASRRTPDVQYVHSESDVPGMVAISTRDARVLGKFEVAIPQQWDWEDIATGPCPSGSCIFAGDIGRVNGKPKPPNTFAVYRVAEPDLAGGETSGTLTGDWFRFRYPDGPHNAEALVVHPISGRIYVITKEQSGKSGVYAFPTTMPDPSATAVTTLTEVARLELPTWTGDPANRNATLGYAQVTAASLHPTGNRLLVRTPFKVYEYRGRSFEDALTATPVALTAPTGERQGEAVEYAADGSAYFTLSEREAPPFTLKRIDRR